MAEFMDEYHQAQADEAYGKLVDQGPIACEIHLDNLSGGSRPRPFRGMGRRYGGYGCRGGAVCAVRFRQDADGGFAGPVVRSDNVVQGWILLDHGLVQDCRE